MRIPTLQGIIKRRILVNYRAAPGIIQKILPRGFRPKLYKKHAIAGICLIRLEEIRPEFAPRFAGFSSENAAHRIAVEWTNGGETKQGVYIPRRDTDSLINSAVGGRLFPGEHHKAVFDVKERGGEIDFAMKSADGEVSVSFAGKLSASLPEDSVFSTLNEASGFFEKGSLGFSPTKNAEKLDGMSLEIDAWQVAPFMLDFAFTSFYENEDIFPKGSIKFDHALLMRHAAHRWRGAESFRLKN